jgi:hypothetical protein
MTFHNNYIFNFKITWLIKLSAFLFVALFLSSSRLATAGMVWETTNAPLHQGYILYSNRSMNGATGRLVSVDYSDPTPNPCYQQISCVVGFGVSHNKSLYAPNTYIFTYMAKHFWSSDNQAGALPQNIAPEIVTVKTIGELYTILRPLGVFPQSIAGNNTTVGYCDPTLAGKGDCIYGDKWEAYSKVCYAFVYKIAGGANNFASPFPGQSCIGPSPPNNECKVDAGAVTLDHGELATDAVNGHRKNENVRISCTYPANANLAILSKDANEKIMLKNDNSLYSTVTIDGVSGVSGKKINIPQGGTTINLESTLHTVGNVEAGPFSGTAILVINNY